jgi:hypothetical protein
MRRFFLSSDARELAGCVGRQDVTCSAKTGRRLRRGKV